MMGRCRRAAAAAAEDDDVGEAGGEVLLPAAAEEDDDMVGDGLRGEAARSLLSELVLSVTRWDVRGMW